MSNLLCPLINEGVGNTAPDGNHSDSNASDDSSASDDSDGTGDNSTPLTTYVDALEAKLGAKVANLDSIYDPATTDDESTDHDLEPIDQNEIQQSAREQTAAGMDAPVDGNSDNDSAYNDSQPQTEPRPRLRQRRAPSYAHLKGRHDNGSLPTVARPHEFGGRKHQAHIILRSIVMTQYNLKQGIQKFGDKGNQAVMTELQQLYDREVMQAVSKSDLTYDKQPGALR
jgi:hypothetical protein